MLEAAACADHLTPSITRLIGCGQYGPTVLAILGA